jgi:hypothetical protein
VVDKVEQQQHIKKENKTRAWGGGGGVGWLSYLLLYFF